MTDTSLQIEKIRSKTIVCDAAGNVAIECLYPIFEVKTKIKFVKSFKKEVPFYGIKCLFEVEEDSKTRQGFCCGVTNNVTDECYVFTDVPFFDVAGLISVIARGRTASSLVAIAFVAILYK